jgi:hypothetical protein
LTSATFHIWSGNVVSILDVVAIIAGQALLTSAKTQMRHVRTLWDISDDDMNFEKQEPFGSIRSGIRLNTVEDVESLTP